MSLISRARLAGPFSQTTVLPQSCSQCGGHDFYQQSDFKRSLGLGMVIFCSIMTFILMGMGYNWFLVWSPMLVALVIDRTFAGLNPLVVVCYKCEHIYRGLSKDLVYKSFGAFDLEIHDRIHYSERNAEV